MHGKWYHRGNAIPQNPGKEFGESPRFLFILMSFEFTADFSHFFAHISVSR